MKEFVPSDFGPVFAALVGGDRNRALDGGQPNYAAKRALEQATMASAFAHVTIVDRDMAMCCLAGAWLVHDFLDESHQKSQSVETSSGSYWHGVMHRREGDFSNAKYWFRHVGPHEVAVELGQHVRALAADESSQSLAERIAPGRHFDPYAMVDACQAALREGGEMEAFCRRVQQVEWELLFTHCYRHAIK
jgi:hypothetical protein